MASSHVQSSAANRYVLAISCHKKQRYVEARAQAIMKLLLLHPLAHCLLFTFSSADHDRCADYSIACGCVSMLTTLNCFWKAPIVTPNGVDFSLLFLSRLIIVRLVFPTCKMHQAASHCSDKLSCYLSKTKPSLPATAITEDWSVLSLSVYILVWPTQLDVQVNKHQPNRDLQQLRQAGGNSRLREGMRLLSLA